MNCCFPCFGCLQAVEEMEIAVVICFPKDFVDSPLVMDLVKARADKERRCDHAASRAAGTLFTAFVPTCVPAGQFQFATGHPGPNTGP